MEGYEWEALIDIFSCCASPIIRYLIIDWRVKPVSTNACTQVKKILISSLKKSTQKTKQISKLSVLKKYQGMVEYKGEILTSNFPNCASPIILDLYHGGLTAPLYFQINPEMGILSQFFLNSLRSYFVHLL